MRRKTQTFLPSPGRDISPDDERALMEQLGYVPPNVCCVSARSGGENGDGDHSTTTVVDTSIGGAGRPIAIKSYPLLVQLHDYIVDANVLDDTDDDDLAHRIPFPTLYWLSCPHVSRAISELERGGYVRIFQRRLEDDDSGLLGAGWWACHGAYADERWDALSARDREWLLREDALLGGGGGGEDHKRRRSMMEMIRTSGVAGTDHNSWGGTRSGGGGGGGGGTASVPSVKCLHSHYAHYRSQLSRCNAGDDNDDDENVVLNMVGKWTHELLLECFPEILL
ncbi:hypothetical protein ACHAXA_007678 [Cyclostephanos tholiformis]|uniref:Uncharacterized protein n=1 Tax=Cyclostephanos tholiformis TaxID=382380 RepID=A0ABD3SDN0_9STRA